MRTPRPALSLLALLTIAFVGSAPARAAEPATDAVNAFTADVLRIVAATGGNTFVSPYSIATAVAMARAGAAGETAAEIDRALHLPSDAPAAFRDLVARLHDAPMVTERDGRDRRETPAYALSVANGLFAHRGWSFVPAFGATLRDAYRAEFAEVDFEDGPAARKAINDWVALKTKDRIKDIVMPPLPSPDTRMAIANAIHFKASWNEPFATRATVEKPFYVAHGGTSREVVAPRMARTAQFAYAETDDATLAEIPYRGGATSMVVLLPKQRDGLDAVVSGLTPARLSAALAGLTSRLVALELPKFSFTTSLEVSPVLRQLGVNAAFSADAADFTGITAQKPLFIGAVLHKAFVAVDEAGTEAAAATVLMMRAGSAARPAEPTPFVVDHPFLFFLRHRATGAILFAGRVVDPTAK